MVAGEGFEPAPEDNTKSASAKREAASPGQEQGQLRQAQELVTPGPVEPRTEAGQSDATARRAGSITEAQPAEAAGCARGGRCAELPPELADLWPRLSERDRGAVLALARTLGARP